MLHPTIYLATPLCHRQAAMCKNNRVAKTNGLTRHLESEVTCRSRIIYHSEQPKISMPKKPDVRIFSPSKCLNAGVCLCGQLNEHDMNRTTFMFVQNLKMFLKEHFWSKKKQKSIGRQKLEMAEIVLHFDASNSDQASVLPSDCSGDEDEESTRVPCPFAHVGFVNFKHWTMTLHRLDYRTPPKDPNDSRVYLQSHALTQNELVDPGCKKVVMTDMDFFKCHLDLTFAYHVQVYAVLQDSEPVEDDQMPLGFVDVEVFKHIASAMIWKGRAVELLARETSKTKSKASKKKNNQKGVAMPLEVDFFADNAETMNVDQGHISHETSSVSKAAALDLENQNDDNDNDSESGNGSDSDAWNENDDDTGDDENESQKEDAGQSTESEDPLGLFEEVQDHDIAAVRSFDFDGLFEPPVETEDTVAEAEPDKPQEEPSSVSKPSRNNSDSSGSSSSSSSSSSDSDSSDEKSGIAIPRALPVTEFAMDIPGFGLLRYNSTARFLRAHCQCAGHGKVCYRRRSVDANAQRPGQGRPIGLLISWMKSSSRFDSQKEHVKASVSSREDRIAARLWFRNLPHASEFEKFERALRPLEASEPDRIL